MTEDPDSTQLPYEAVINTIRAMAHRLGGSENTFNPHMLVPLIERYALEHQRDVGPDRWVPDLFIDVGWTFESCIAVLQNLWYANVAPFTGAGNRVLASHIVYLVSEWYEASLGRNERPFGGEDTAREIERLLEAVVQKGQTLAPADRQLIEEVRRKIVRSFR